MCALKWTDVDISNEIINVRSTVSRVTDNSGNAKTKLIIDSPKTQASNRKIPIPDKGDVKALVKTMLVYATSGDQAMLEYQSVENAIKEMQAKANETELMCIRTEGNKELYLEQIKKYYASIARMRERLNELKKQFENSDTYRSELKQIDEWLSEEEVSFEEYDDSIVRYLVSSIRVTEDMNLIINIKGGGSITEPIYCEKG